MTKLAKSVLAALCWSDTGEPTPDDPVSNSLACRIGTLTGLKTFPVVAGKVISILNKHDFTVDEIADTIREDPALAAGVLRLANSAFFAPSHRIVTLDQAFIRLGRDIVQEVVFAVATMELFPDFMQPGKAIRDHCAATAAISHTLAVDLEPEAKETMFLCGLMHDIGKMLLIDSKELSYPSENLSETMQPNISDLYEREKLGFDHAVLTGQVLDSWKLAQQIVNVVAWHHQPALAYTNSEVGPSVAMLRLADQIEAHLSFPTRSKEEFLTDLLQSEDWKFFAPRNDFLEKRWDTLVSARDASLSLFGG